MTETKHNSRAQTRRQPAARHQPGRAAPGRLRIDRRRRINRRRLALLSVVAAVVAIVSVAALPYARKAIQHFELPLQYSSIIRQQARVNRLDPALIAAVIYSETRFDPRTSDTGAEGLMQLEPATAEFLAKRSGGTGFSVSDLGTPAVNIAYGSYYLRYLLNEFHGSEVLAVAAYNGGDANVHNWVSAAQARGQRFRVNDIPLSQTRAYVTEVMTKQREYHERYPNQLGYS